MERFGRDHQRWARGENREQNANENHPGSFGPFAGESFLACTRAADGELWQGVASVPASVGLVDETLLLHRVVRLRIVTGDELGAALELDNQRLDGPAALHEEPSGGTCQLIEHQDFEGVAQDVRFAGVAIGGRDLLGISQYLGGVLQCGWDHQDQLAPQVQVLAFGVLHFLEHGPCSDEGSGIQCCRHLVAKGGRTLGLVLGIVFLRGVEEGAAGVVLCGESLIEQLCHKLFRVEAGIVCKLTEGGVVEAQLVALHVGDLHRNRAFPFLVLDGEAGTGELFDFDLADSSFMPGTLVMNS